MDIASSRALYRVVVPSSFAFSSFFFSFLAGISSVLFESRIGCLNEVVPEETERFIQCINTMFVMTLLTMAMPSWMHQLFPKPWNIFCQCWDYMFEFGRSLLSLLTVMNVYIYCIYAVYKSLFTKQTFNMRE